MTTGHQDLPLENAKPRRGGTRQSASGESSPVQEDQEALRGQLETLQRRGSARGPAAPLSFSCEDAEEAVLPLDNNASESALRTAALGRKNYLFVGNDEAGANVAGLYSLVAT